MRSFASVPSAALNLQLAEEVLYDLPPLEGVFLYWHTHGVTSTAPGITSLLARREQMLGVATLSGASIRLLALGQPPATRSSAAARSLSTCCRDPGAASTCRTGSEDHLRHPWRAPAALH